MMTNQSNLHRTNMFILVAATLLGCFVFPVECLNFSYANFTQNNVQDFPIAGNSNIALNAIQVTTDVRGGSIANLSGRIWYKKPFRLWSKRKNRTASFNSTFVINITPQTNPWGEGLAFILTKNISFIPENSDGQWLGIVNASTNGSSGNNIIAVEFDTRKSYLEDIDSNHVGVDINSVYSTSQVSLTRYGVNISNATDITASVQYNGVLKNLSIYVFETNRTEGSMKNAIISLPLDLSNHLPEHVYVGFSASTGAYTELNCIKSWNFTSIEIDDDAASVLWVVLMGIAILVVVIVSGFLFYLYRKRKHEENQASDEEDPKVEQQIKSSGTAPQKFQLKELKRATGNFDPKNMLGKGGCGVVYRGLLGNNKEVAVKRFSNNSSQGKQEFIAEVSIIGNLHHRNLVRLVGWCYESNELLVVYDFMPNGSLEKIIYRDDSQRPRLGWERRNSIIFGVAQALDYLHNGCENRVLHRDIKASNIMLDSEFNARLGDFGLARTILGSAKTHHSTKEIAGTPGYMAPECFHTDKATVETDVYAFGVLILEVACERRPVIQQNRNKSISIIDWVWELYGLGRIIDAINVEVTNNKEEEEVECALKLGLACCHPNPNERPSMRIVLQVLTGEASPPPIPTEKPAFMWPVMAASFKEYLDNSLAGGQLTPVSELSGR